MSDNTLTYRRTLTDTHAAEVIESLGQTEAERAPTTLAEAAERVKWATKYYERLAAHVDYFFAPPPGFTSWEDSINYDLDDIEHNEAQVLGAAAQLLVDVSPMYFRAGRPLTAHLKKHIEMCFTKEAIAQFKADGRL